MKKLQKRYYILIFVFAIAAGVLFKCFEDDSFRIVKNSAVYAPERDTALATADDTESSVNINEADMYTLCTLPEIGDVMAERIIEYRTVNGKFEVKEDIMKVRGIGRKTFDEIKDYICIE